MSHINSDGILNICGPFGEFILSLQNKDNYVDQNEILGVYQNSIQPF